MNNIVIGLIRGLGYPILVLVLTYFMKPENIQALGFDTTISVVLAGFVSVIDHAIEMKTGKALLGTVRRS